MVELLLENGAEINAQDNHGLTALHRAVVYGNTEASKVLLENGIDVNLQDKSDYTALGVALRGDFEETADLIESYGE